MLITHNIAVAQYLSDVVAVMYAGHVVEYGPTKAVLAAQGIRTQITLMNAAPIGEPWKRNLAERRDRGEVPSSINPPPGCRFNPRCPYAEGICTQVDPPLEEVSLGTLVACHFKEKTLGVAAGAAAAAAGSSNETGLIRAREEGGREGPGAETEPTSSSERDPSHRFCGVG